MELKDLEKFKLLTGVTKSTFEEMLKVLTAKYNEIHKKGGNKGVPVGLKLVIALEYWREYRGMRQMGFDYDMPSSTICDCILWVENILSKSDKFQLTDLKERFKPKESEDDIEIILIDVEEQPIERPKYNQRESYSGKKNSTQPNTKL